MKKSCLSVARVCPLLAHSLNSSQTEDTWGIHLLPLTHFKTTSGPPVKMLAHPWSWTLWLKALQVMLMACWCVPSTDANSGPV